MPCAWSWPCIAPFGKVGVSVGCPASSCVTLGGMLYTSQCVFGVAVSASCSTSASDWVFAGAPDQLNCGLVPPLAPAHVYIVGMVPPLVKAGVCSVKPLVAEPVKRMAVTYAAFEMAGEADAAAEGDGPTEAAGDAAGLITADGEAAGEGEGETTGFAAGEVAGATVGAAAGGVVGEAGAAELQPTRPSAAP